MNLKVNLVKLPQFLFVLLTICDTLSTEVPRPLGVSLSRAALYDPDNEFMCLDGSKKIPFLYVNDDFCDCSDASDEPGTSACPHGTFYCTNAGHKPLNLISSRVNDGICDCCDGSDEYLTKHCINNCMELGKFAREEAQRQAELLKSGKEIRLGYMQQGVQLKQEKREKLTELEKNKEEAEKIKNEKKILKDEIELLENSALEYYRKLEQEEKQRNAEIEENKNREEALEAFKKFDSNQDGLVDLAELKTRETFDKDRNGEVSEEEAKFFLNELDSVDIDKFITDAWPNIKPYLMLDSGLFKPPTTENYDKIEDTQANNDETNNDEEDTHEAEESFDEDTEQLEEENEQSDNTSPSTLKYDDETQALVNQATLARNEFAEAEKNVRDIENDIKNIENYLSKDFGYEEEFAVIEGVCFEYEDHEYIYKLCPFDKTIQQPKSGGAETKLGSWGHWDSSENNKYDFMVYDSGHGCWNGPQRSTIVRLSCGIENKVISVSEPNRCEYVFDFITPAACRDSLSELNDDIHDEL